MDTPEQETLEKASIKFAENNFRIDQPMHIPYWLSKSFIAGAEWERERAKVLVEALEDFQLGHTHEAEDKHIRMQADTYGWCSYCQETVVFGRDEAREALAKYRGGG